MRELEEETGYLVEIVDEIMTKKRKYSENYMFIEVHYFLVKLIGGKRKIQDPDNLIYDIAWKTIDEINTKDLSFPEDREIFNRLLKKRI
ncbi:NUDIX domain-containing protein [Lysinibacillus sp. NPDC097287]|uniref:NUDIX domain-containing protein n=1 Tax=Lysinibacillus sp. NPDC097287 TaxID=3364144 RepID=UPI00382E9122